jgi:fibrillarin-like rRNA methylase
MIILQQSWKTHDCLSDTACCFILADVAQPDQAHIVTVNAHGFLKNGGHAVISIKANCIDSSTPSAQVFAREAEELRKGNLRPVLDNLIAPTRLRLFAGSCG